MRLLSPHVGAGFGLHCPLHKGTEVAVGFMDGNPDRPILLGAAPNPENKSQVTSDNQTQCRLTTAGGHKLHIEDKDGSQRILLQAATGDYLRIGAPNDPAAFSDGDWDNLKQFGNEVWSGMQKAWDAVENELEDIGEKVWDVYFSQAGFRLYAPSNHAITITIANAMQVVAGEYMLNILGLDNELYGDEVEVSLDLKFSFKLAASASFENYHELAAGVRTGLHTVANWVHGRKRVAALTQTEVYGQKTDAALSQSETVGDRLDVAESESRFAGERTEATATQYTAAMTQRALAATDLQAANRANDLVVHEKQTAAQTTSMGDRVILSTASSIETIERQRSEAQRLVDTAVNKVTMAQKKLESSPVNKTN